MLKSRLTSVLLASAFIWLPVSITPEAHGQKISKKNQKKSKRTKKKRKKRKKAPSHHGESWAARSKFKYGVGLGPATSGMGGVGGTVFEGFYLQSPGMQWGLSYFTGTYNLETDEDPNFILNEASVSGSLALARLRYFMGNSFYITASVGQRSIEATIDVESTTAVNQIIITSNSSSIVAGLNIGNAWTWDNGFTLNADWFGYYVPLSSSYTSSTTTRGDVTAAQQVFAEEAETLGKSLGETPHAQALIFTLGILF